MLYIKKKKSKRWRIFLSPLNKDYDKYVINQNKCMNIQKKDKKIDFMNMVFLEESFKFPQKIT